MEAARLRGIRAHPARRDAAIAAFWLAVGIALWAFGLTGLWRGAALFEVDRWAFLVTLAAAVALLPLRSSRPLVALSLGAAVALVDTLMGASLAVVFVFTDLIYAAVKYSSARAIRGLLRVAAAGAVALATVLVMTARAHPGLAVMLVQWGLIIAVSALWGWNVRAERAHTAAELSAQHADETRELRTKIAHDLHDLVANQIAVAGLHVEAAKLQAGKLAAGAPAGSGIGAGEAAAPGGPFGPLLQSLDRAKAGTDRAHRELRGLISVLTVVEQAGDSAPVDLESELHALGQLLPAGRAIRWGSGAEAAIRRALSAQHAQRARIVLRALHELIANVAKHGAGDAELLAEVAPGQESRPERGGGAAGERQRLRIRIANAPAPPPATERLGGGLGIEGTRVLLASIGGALESRATPDGWLATVTLPLPTTEREHE